MPKGRKTGFDAVIREITPSNEEMADERRTADLIIKKIDAHLPAHAKAMLAGSVAKGTFLRDSKDIDIFILFPKSIDKEKFEGIVRKIAAKAFPKEKKEVHYAEHPYVRVKFENRKIDVVPAYDIKIAEEKASAVDRSVLHTKYILRKLPNIRRTDVLLLKRLFKANGLYGAEIRVEGFSGYLCELLIIKYGSFMNTMRAITKWKTPITIDIEKQYPNAKRPLEKFNVPLIVIDPVDKQRNVAAIVSLENIKRIIKLAKRIVKKPNQSFFSGSEKEFKEKELKRLLASTYPVYILQFPKPNIVDDILWGQLKRFERNTISGLEHLGFKVMRTLLCEENGQCELFFGLEIEKLGQKMLLKGPPIRNDLKNNAESFRKAHKRAKFIKKSGHVFAIVNRKIRDATDAFKLIISKEQNVPSHIDASKIKINKKRKN
jgi:tRNA nucleotidyltransferase (CCA-adding enzyme)